MHDFAKGAPTPKLIKPRTRTIFPFTPRNAIRIKKPGESASLRNQAQLTKTAKLPFQSLQRLSIIHNSPLPQKNHSTINLCAKMPRLEQTEKQGFLRLKNYRLNWGYYALYRQKAR